MSDKQLDDLTNAAIAAWVVSDSGPLSMARSIVDLLDIPYLDKQATIHEVHRRLFQRRHLLRWPISEPPPVTEGAIQ